MRADAYAAILDRRTLQREADRLAFIRAGQRTEVDDEGLLVVLDDLNTPLDWGPTHAWHVRTVIAGAGMVNVVDRMVWADTAEEAGDRVLADIPDTLRACIDQPRDLGPVEPDTLGQRVALTLDAIAMALAA